MIGDKKACVDSLFVLPDHRKNKIASRLMQKVEDHAKTQGATEVTLESAHVLTEAHQFYLHRDYRLVGSRPLEKRREQVILRFSKAF